MKQIADKFEYKSMSGQFFLSKVQPVNVLNHQQLISIMTHFLNNDADKNGAGMSEKDNMVRFDQYDSESAEIMIRGDSTQIVTNGKVRIHSTTGQFASKHGQAFCTGFIKEFVCTVWICLTNTNSLMNPVRNDSPCFEANCPVVEWILTREDVDGYGLGVAKDGLKDDMFLE